MAISRPLPLIVSGVALVVATFAAVSQRERPPALEGASVDSARQLDDMESRLARVSERLDLLERRLVSATSTPISLPAVTNDFYRAQHAMRVYQADANLRIGSDVVVSSPTGVMVSDQAQKTIVGDLTIESPTGTLETSEAVVEAADGAFHVKATTLSFTPKESKEDK